MVDGAERVALGGAGALPEDAEGPVLHAQVARRRPRVAALRPPVGAGRLGEDALKELAAAAVLEGGDGVKLEHAVLGVRVQELDDGVLHLLHPRLAPTGLVGVPVGLALRVEDGGEDGAELPHPSGADQVEERVGHAEGADVATDVHALLVLRVVLLAQVDEAAGVDPREVEVACEELVGQFVQVLCAAGLDAPADVLPASTLGVGGLADGDASRLVGANLVHEDGAVEVLGGGQRFTSVRLVEGVELGGAVGEVRLDGGGGGGRAARDLAAHECLARAPVLRLAAEAEHVGARALVRLGGDEAAAVAGLYAGEEAGEVAQLDDLRDAI